MFGPGRGLPFDWRLNGRGEGKHNLIVTLLSDKNPESKDRYINVIGFEVFARNELTTNNRTTQPASG